MDYFVMGERQDEILRESIEQREGKMIVVVTPVYAVLPHVFQHVVHPAHVPLEVEAQAADIGRARDHSPGSGLLRESQRVRVLQVHYFIEALEERNRLQVFPPAELI